MNKDDGGPAFPVLETDFRPGTDRLDVTAYYALGLTKHDVFAALALAGYNSNVVTAGAIDAEKKAGWAIMDADALLKVKRERVVDRSR